MESNDLEMKQGGATRQKSRAKKGLRTGECFWPLSFLRHRRLFGEWIMWEKVLVSSCEMNIPQVGSKLKSHFSHFVVASFPPPLDRTRKLWENPTV